MIYESALRPFANGEKSNRYRTISLYPITFSKQEKRRTDLRGRNIKNDPREPHQHSRRIPQSRQSSNDSPPNKTLIPRDLGDERTEESKRVTDEECCDRTTEEPEERGVENGEDECVEWELVQSCCFYAGSQALCERCLKARESV